MSKKIIPPGERGRVKITLDVPNKNKALEQAVELYTNDPNYPIIKFKLKAFAVMPIITIPPRIFWGSFFPEEPVSKELIVRKVSSPEAKILSIRTSSKHLIAAIAEPDSNGDAKVTLIVQQNIPVGKLDEKLWIDYSHEGSRATLEVPIAGEALGDVRVFPQRFFFGLVEAKTAASKNVTLSRIKGDLLRILSAKNASKYVSTEIITAEDGNKYQIKTTISPDAPAGELFDTVIVQTNHRKQPEIKIPLYCIVIKPK